jgi:hypothetical protein
MVDFEIWPALLAGFLGTVTMTVMMNMAKAAGMTNMPPMPLVMGSMMTGDKKKAMALGSMAHFVVMGTVVFGTVYAALFTAFDNDGWWVGALIGLAHGLLVGLMAMPMMPTMHPRMERELVSVGGRDETQTVVTDHTGEVHVAAPGVLGSRWGGMTPVGLVMGHVIYGVVVALVYTWVA